MTANEWTIRQKSILALCALAIVLDGFDTQVIGFAAPALLADWNITKADLAPILGIGLLGMALGAAAGGFVGDRFGRRVGMIASTLVFGLATCAMAGAESLWTLGILRFVAGLGLGGALPIAAALVAEFTPPNRKSLAVSISIICIPIGGIVGGLFAAPLLPIIGWRGLFIIAGVLPLAVAVVHLFTLPESPSFLESREDQRVNPRKEAKLGAALTEQEGTRPGFFRSLSSQHLLGDTFALWAAFCASLMSGYLYFNWLPVLLADAGFELSATSVGLLVYNIGCVVAGVAVGAIATQVGTRGPLLLLAAFGAVGALALMLFPPTPSQSELLMIALAVQGFCLGGVQPLLYALAVHVFPPQIRATGIGSAASVGRIGAILSSALGAIVLAWGAQGFFLSIAIAQAACAACILLVRRHDTGSVRTAPNPV
ncbi:MFS transporter [Sphingopyxis flava]|uniref:MFS transporter, AAHS family, 4-hydroxybenzoate transporter n=1 Tax=Sphingopyxis flava TaxID=1507287 RepID=A0A1T5FTX6_9SPHN|nr:MFS transporter [Sphingopyxis flava]SKB99596.1 MFS transporter, AAHS family, 4-hydroxybenzoate transporter [Sphingopyxis flava]